VPDPEYKGIHINTVHVVNNKNNNNKNKELNNTNKELNNKK